MNKRTIDEMIAYFNQEVSKMDISQENKIKLLGMITAIGYESKKQEVVRCRECKYAKDENFISAIWCENLEKYLAYDFFCADGERKEK